jgi:hypothetical protein
MGAGAALHAAHAAARLSQPHDSDAAAHASTRTMAGVPAMIFAIVAVLIGLVLFARYPAFLIATLVLGAGAFVVYAMNYGP